jgi:hypothetical protein
MLLTEMNVEIKVIIYFNSFQNNIVFFSFETPVSHTEEGEESRSQWGTSSCGFSTA